MRRRLLLLTSAVMLGCASPPPSSSGSLRVVVHVEPGLGSRCARVIARGSAQRDSSPVLLSGRTSFVIGIAQEHEPEEVILQAQGFADDECTRLSVPAENSEPLVTRFGTPTTSAMLVLRQSPGLDAGVDADGDGFVVGLDCDDRDATVHPAAKEVCQNGVDDDCNRAVDCADPGCLGQACGVNGRCNGTVCLAPTEAGLCADGLDNDADGEVDCDDTDCPMGTACNDSNACTDGDVCGSPGQGCRGAARVCNQPPAAQCFAPTGQCVAGTCSYPVTPGPCSDGLACTEGDACAADGTCRGTQRSCATPPGPCFVASGTCSESQSGACSYAPRTGACDDGDSCTRNDTCGGAGACTGTPVTCTPPGECFAASGCSASGGCLFSVRSGACTGGSCNAAGVCVPSGPAFPLTPTNFSTSQLPPSAGAVVLSCDVTIDTRAAGGALGWTTCAGGAPAPQWAVVNGAMLLFFDSLTIGASATVTARGDRPLILAAQGAVLIDGTLTASSDGVKGAGSELSCGRGVGENGGAGGNPQTAGGGGGGGFGANGGRGSEGDHGGDEGDRGDANGNGGLAPLRGGCRGGDGGRASPGSGLGGRGGGAVQVTAASITLGAGATVSAQGEGGKGGAANLRVGGGGGGSGGAVFLEANRLTISPGAAVVANGGEGGEGSGFSNGADGQSGQRSTSRASSFAIGCGGNGGSGGARNDGAGNGRDPDCGNRSPGGGGGGSVGRIRFNALTACDVSGWALVSPAANATSNCRDD
ncbi:MAG: putative metal-binding motif-containing protein [Archangium sp.]|nr:putative metal-binding motif-containing protein [Archangium sp.]MDP3569403.1 putative metal-binding motif-containing protein [Archangium sp.]